MARRSIAFASCLLISCGGQVGSSETPTPTPSPSSSSSSGSPGNPGGSSTPSAPAPTVDATASIGFESIATWQADIGAVYAADGATDSTGNGVNGSNISRISISANGNRTKTVVVDDFKNIGSATSLNVVGAAGEPTYFWNNQGSISSNGTSPHYVDDVALNTFFVVDEGPENVYFASQRASGPVTFVAQTFAPTTKPSTIFASYAPTGFRLGNGTLYAIQNGYEVDVDLATMNQTPFAQKDLPAFTDLTARTADGSVFLASNAGVWIEKNGAYSSFLATTHGAVTQVEVAGTSLLVLEVDPNSGVATLAEISIANATGEKVIATDVTSQARFAFDSANVYFISADQTRVQHVAL